MMLGSVRVPGEPLEGKLSSDVFEEASVTRCTTFLIPPLPQKSFLLSLGLTEKVPRPLESYPRRPLRVEGSLLGDPEPPAPTRLRVQ